MPDQLEARQGCWVAASKDQVWRVCKGERHKLSAPALQFHGCKAHSNIQYGAYICTPLKHAVSSGADDVQSEAPQLYFNCGLVHGMEGCLCAQVKAQAAMPI